MTKREEQDAFERLAKEAGDLTVQASSIADFEVDDIKNEDRREAWETFMEEWDDHVDELHNALLALMEAGGFKPKGGADWLS